MMRSPTGTWRTFAPFPLNCLPLSWNELYCFLTLVLNLYLILLKVSKFYNRFSEFDVLAERIKGLREINAATVHSWHVGKVLLSRRLTLSTVANKDIYQAISNTTHVYSWFEEKLTIVFGIWTEPTEPILSPAGEQPSSSEKIRKELQRRNSRPTVERTSPKPHRLRRQSTILDEFGTKRRGSKYVF